MTTIPTWEEFIAPSLRVLSDGRIHRTRDICQAASDQLGITDEQREELVPSGQRRYLNRANWALSYLSRSGATEKPMRGHHRITDAGRSLLAQRPGGITEHDLRALGGYGSPHSIPSPTPSTPFVPSEENEPLDPTEQIETGIARIHETVAADLLVRLHGNEPAFFEQAVLDLLIAMGYGGTEGRATRTRLVADGGIDGVVDQDALGLSRIYVQAKRYALDTSVGRPEIQGFVGALHGNQAGQGVFITTGRFSTGARAYAESVPTRVVLIDGERLAALMIRYGVGVQVRRMVQIVEVDEDFFE